MQYLRPTNEWHINLQTYQWIRYLDQEVIVVYQFAYSLFTMQPIFKALETKQWAKENPRSLWIYILVTYMLYINKYFFGI